jgi:hypothetical protein
MNRFERRRQEKLSKSARPHDKMQFGEALSPVPQGLWPAVRPAGLIEVWRSRKYLMQVYETGFPETLRLTICRAQNDFDEEGRSNRIPWDDLQQLKRACGRGHLDALEVYPADEDLVTVTNHRHLWVMPHKVPFAWRKERADAVPNVQEPS